MTIDVACRAGAATGAPSAVYGGPAIHAAAPVPCLRLFSDEIVLHRADGTVLGGVYETQLVPLIELTFAYGMRRVPCRDDGLSDPFRDGVAEASAMRLLETLGATDLECLEGYATDPDARADFVVRPGGSVHDACAFSTEALPRLRAAGWQVEIAADYAFKVVAPEPRWYADVEVDGEKKDWFNLELGVEIDGRRLDLVPALVELLQQLSNGDDLRDLERRATRPVAVPVEDGLFLAVPADRLRTILRILTELYDERTGAMLSASRLRAGALPRLDEVFQQEGKTLTWSGNAAPRAWAQALTECREPVTTPATVRAQLRPYQLEGLAFLQRLREAGVGGVLADDMGLGKTLQTISHIAMEKEQGRLTQPALIVAPTSLVGNWRREIGKFAPHLVVVVMQGTDRHRRWAEAARADVIITSYPIVLRDEERLAELGLHLLVLDEAQTIKNDRSRAHRAVKAIQADHRLALTGTPIENHLGEVWAIFDFLNPGLLGDELSFSRFYRVPIEKLADEERLVALRQLLSPYILRRMKRDVAKELPPKTDLLVPVELTGRQRELYESIRAAAHAEVRSLIKKRGLAASTVPILGMLTKLRQVCCDPRLVPLPAADGVRESGKLTRLLQLIDERRAMGSRLLVFSQFTTMLGIIEEALRQRRIAYAKLTGQTADRQAAVDRFESGEVDVFLISLRAGGTGLTLTSADTVVHYDPWWNPAVQLQATDRAYRIGQTRPVFSHHLYVAGSVEERMLRLQQRKQRVADALLGTGERGEPLGEAEIEMLLAPLTV